jgi:hypothetical protein
MGEAILKKDVWQKKKLNCCELCQTGSKLALLAY